MDTLLTASNVPGSISLGTFDTSLDTTFKNTLQLQVRVSSIACAASLCMVGNTCE